MDPASIALLGSLAQGVLSTGASVENTTATINANKELAEYAYTKDLEMWNRGNAYNAPAAQMQRIEAAGLNKNLVYGTGVTGNAASQLPKYQAPNVKYDIEPQLNLVQAISAYQDLKIKAQQVDNLKALESVNIAKTVTEGIKQSAIAQGTARSKFDLELAQELRETSLETQRANLRKNIAEIQNLTTTTELREKESKLKGYELDDREVGLTPSDPLILRGINRLRKDPQGAIDYIMNYYDKNFGTRSVPFEPNKR